jgi:hypothetical protein
MGIQHARERGSIFAVSKYMPNPIRHSFENKRRTGEKL